MIIKGRFSQANSKLVCAASVLSIALLGCNGGGGDIG